MNLEFIEKANRLLEERKFNDALRLYNRLIDDEPDNAIAYQGAAECYLNLREFQKSLDLCSEALRLNPDSVMSHVIMAFGYHNLNLFEKGLEQAKTALELDSESPDALGCYGTLLLAESKVDDALPYLQKAAELDPQSYLIHNNLAYAYKLHGDTKNYIEANKTVYRMMPNVRNATLLVRAYIESKSMLISFIIAIITLLSSILDIKYLLIFPILTICFSIIAVIRLLITKRRADFRRLLIATVFFGLALLIIYTIPWLILRR